MAKKKNKNNPIVNIEVDTEANGPPADPNVPDLPTPKINVHVSNANANANANVGAVGGGGDAKTQHLIHEHNHHHSHYARSVDRDSAGGEKVVERKEVVDVNESGEATKTKTVKETTSGNKVSTAKAVSSNGRPASIHPPSSPAKSIRSLSQSTPPHQPDIIVNITVPPAAIAPALAPVPAPALPLPAPIARPPSIAPATVPLPLSSPPSPSPTVRSLPAAKAKSARNVVAVPIPEEDEVEEEVTVTTTTRKIRKTPSPPIPAAVPLPPAPPLQPAYMAPGTPLVISDPTWKPEPDPRPSITSRPPSIMAVDKGKDHGFVETTVVETVTHPAKEKSSFFDKLKLPKFIKPTDTGPGGSPPRNPAGDNHIQVRIHPGGDVDVDIDKPAVSSAPGIVLGQTNTKVPIKALGQEPAGTKAGIRPIPIIDYKALINLTPPRRQPSLPSVTERPAAPKTILTMSADIERDSNGDPHYKARVRDHTGVKKVDKVVHKKNSKEKTHQDAHGGVDLHVPGVDLHIDTQDSGSDSETEVVENKKERKARREREKREKRQAAAPLYKRLNGAYPAPLSERYAMPPAMEDIQNGARQRYERRLGFASPPIMGYGGGYPGGTMLGIGGMGMPGMGMGLGGVGHMVGAGGPRGVAGPPFPTPGPLTMPRPPPFMGQRPPMYGGFNAYPMPGMGMPINNSRMGMGMGQMGYGMGNPQFNGAGYGWGGNPRFPPRGM